MPDPVRIIVHKQFLGLRTSIADPPSNSAKELQNLVLHRRRGILEQANGYALKFDDGPTDLPQVTDANGPNYIDPVIHKITSLNWENIHNFFVPDHGGKRISVAVGKYTKASFFPTSPSTDQFGVWVRPWYDPVQLMWSDDPEWDTHFPLWQELTEFQVFELIGPGSGGIFPQLSDGVTFADDASAGSVAWVSPGNAQTRDGIAAYVDLTAINHTSHYLKIGGVDLSTLLPGAISVVGIEVFIRVKSGVGSLHTVNVSSIRLTKNGAIVGDDKGFSAGAPLPPTGVYVDVKRGSSVDTWGAGIGPADTLGVVIAVHNALEESTAHADIDYVYFKVYTQQPGDYRLFVSTGIVKYNFHGIDGVNAVFNDDYFKGWTLVYNQLEDAENYDLIRNCGYDGNNYFLELHHSNTDFSTRVNGTKLIAYRNFIHRAFPVDISSFIYNLLNEIRLTTGNKTADVSLMAGFRANNLVITDQSTKLQYDLSRDALICDAQTMDFWQYAAIIGINADVGGVDQDPLPNATYYVKYALRMDDGSISKMYSSGSKILGGTKELKLDIYRSLGAFPRRGSALVIFISDDNLRFFKVTEVDLMVASTFTAVGVYNLPGVGKHQYAYGTTQITNALWSGDNPLSSVYTDKDDADDGIIRYKQAMVLAPVVYTAGVRDASQDKLYQNQVFVSAIDGDTRRQYDVFPNDPTHVIDIEYSDGDDVVALGAVDQVIVAVKRRAIVTLTRNERGGYDKQLVTKGYGIAAFLTMVPWDDLLLWLDYNGVLEFSTRGMRVLNPAWIQDLRDMSDATKEAATAVLDRVNRQYRLSLNGKMYIMDLDTKEWTMENFALAPARFATDTTGTIDFLNGNSLEVIGKGNGLQDGAPFTFYYETNEVQHEVDDEDIDLNVVELTSRYRSDVDLTLILYKNDTSEVMGTWILPSTKSRVRVKALSARCSSFRLRLSGTIAQVGQKVKILRLGAKYEEFPAGGTELVE